ncbi:MAG TPA: SiaB family protein kinase [Chryseosolibacter sp.]|nr:SiaB family protein kinase [Chryseosolibacter sp.]
MNFIYDLHRTMASEDLILVYQGDFSQETTKTILTMAERSLQVAEEDPAIRRKVFNVMVELLQNIVKHNEELALSRMRSQNAIFLIGRESKRYTIMSGNPVEKSHAAQLKANLKRINELDKEGLKALYKEIIRDATLSDKGGAGLGFVDMARKSGEKLWFDFPEMSEACCFFCLKVYVSRDSHDN